MRWNVYCGTILPKPKGPKKTRHLTQSLLQRNVAKNGNRIQQKKKLDKTWDIHRKSRMILGDERTKQTRQKRGREKRSKPKTLVPQG